MNECWQTMKNPHPKVINHSTIEGLLMGGGGVTLPEHESFGLLDIDPKQPAPPLPEPKETVLATKSTNLYGDGGRGIH